MIASAEQKELLSAKIIILARLASNKEKLPEIHEPLKKIAGRPTIISSPQKAKTSPSNQATTKTSSKVFSISNRRIFLGSTS